MRIQDNTALVTTALASLAVAGMVGDLALLGWASLVSLAVLFLTGIRDPRLSPALERSKDGGARGR